MNENMKKISQWQVLTPAGFRDFEGVKKVTKDYVLKITLENDQHIICSGGHQLFVKQKKQDPIEVDSEGFLFADLIQPFEMLIQTRDAGYQTVICVEKICESQDMFDLVNVAGGYQYYTNDILSHNCAHVEGIDDLWLGLWPTLSCLVGKTKVFTDKGIFSIEDFHKDRFIGEYFEIDGWQVYGKNGLELLSHGYVSPESDTIKLTTKHGYNVEGTLKHPLWVFDSLGGSMKQIQHIKPGDYLRVQVGMNCYGNSEYNGVQLNKDIAYMLGGYIAEGNMVKGKNSKGDTAWNGVQITNTDSDFRTVFKNASSAGFAKNFYSPSSKPDKLFCFSTKIAKQFMALGINPYEKCYNKHTPKSIWTSSKEDTCAYLSGLFDGDGSVSSRGIVLNSTSKDLIEETQLLLSNLGFISNIYYISGDKSLERERKTGRLMPQGKPVQSLRDSWQIQISRSQFRKFGNEIGFRIGRKQQKLLSLSAIYDQDDEKLYNVPVSIVHNTLTDIIKRFNKTDAWFRSHGLRMDKWKSSGKKGTRFLTQDWLKRFRKLINDNDFKETAEDTKFFDNVIGNFIWDPVVALKAGTAQTYDFTVPNTHTFIQNGILGSNTGGSAILISSPSGVGTLFHKIWVASKDGEDGDGKPYPGKGQNNFYRIELPWTVHPERDQEWYEAQRAEILPAKGERGVGMELLCSFAASGENFLSADVLEDMEKQIKHPIATYGDRGEVWIWKYAEADHKYIISGDVSRGDADDYSTLHVIDTNTDEVVCEYQGKCPPEKLAELMMDLGFKYNQALLCPELNSFGLIVATDIKKAQYPNIYYERIHRSNAYMAYTTADVANDLPGFTTGPKNRDEILAKLETVIRTRRLKIYSARTVEEFKTFIWKNNKAQAMKSYNDDLIIALAIGNSLYEAAGVNAWDDKSVTMAMIAGMSKSTSTMNGIGNQFGEETQYMPPILTSDGVKEYANYQDLKNKHEQGKHGPQDFRNEYWRQWAWLLK